MKTIFIIFLLGNEMNIVLHGNWQIFPQVILELLKADFMLSWDSHDLVQLSDNSHPTAVDFYLLSCLKDLPVNRKGWLGWDVTPEGNLTTLAYQRGAIMVFPAGIEGVDMANALKMLFPDPKPAARPVTRTFNAGTIIFLEPEQVMLVDEGVIAYFVVHRDGNQTLIGLAGSGQLVLPHPADNCHLDIIAFTDVRAVLFQWSEIYQYPDFFEKLRQRIYLTEAWASVQARPYLEDRLFGVLGLLGEQFGKHHEEGCLIDLHLPHQLLANAIGANRSTITRLLSQLKQRDLLRVVGKGKNKRLVLTQFVAVSHR